MVLVLADKHFGKSDARSERDKEHDVIRCLLHFQSSPPGIREVVLLGDVFEHYIEYRHLVPKGYTRFKGHLAELCDSGVEITYFAGNHDPWHVDYFEQEFNARFVEDDEHRTIGSTSYYLTHGDGAPPIGGLYGRIKWLLRHPLPVNLYKRVLPGDLGMGLAKWVNGRYAARTRSEATVRALRQFAEELLEAADRDVVVMGHSHSPELTEMKGGVYLNPGSWHHQRTFALITDSGPRLMRWGDDGASELASYDSAPRTSETDESGSVSAGNNASTRVVMTGRAVTNPHVPSDPHTAS